VGVHPLPLASRLAAATAAATGVVLAALAAIRAPDHDMPHLLALDAGTIACLALGAARACRTSPREEHAGVPLEEGVHASCEVPRAGYRVAARPTPVTILVEPPRALRGILVAASGAVALFSTGAVSVGLLADGASARVVVHACVLAAAATIAAARFPSVELVVDPVARTLRTSLGTFDVAPSDRLVVRDRPGTNHGAIELRGRRVLPGDHLSVEQLASVAVVVAASLPDLVVEHA
jgi:hypothetical protein